MCINLTIYAKLRILEKARVHYEQMYNGEQKQMQTLPSWNLFLNDMLPLNSGPCTESSLSTCLSGKC